MKILVVDDEPLARDELCYLLKTYDSHLAIQEADSIATCLALLVQEVFDVVFLDIHLTNESGLTLAEMINKMPQPPTIVFATAYDQYALSAFEHNARDYLLKPYDLERLRQTMDKIKREHQMNQPSKRYLSSHPIEEDGRIHLVPTHQIIQIEAQQGKTLIYTKEKVYESPETLSAWEERLDRKYFMRTHRAYLVQLEKIETIEPWFNQTLQLNLAEGFKAPVSRHRVKAIKEQLGL